MKILRLADQDLAGKRVFIRADLNVPQDDDCCDQYAVWPIHDASSAKPQP